MNYSSSLFVFLITSLTFFSCSDDVSVDPSEGEPEKNYFPVEESNYWVYGTSQTTAEGTTTSSDSTVIRNSFTIDSTDFRLWSPVNRLFVIGDSTYVRKEGEKTYLRLTELNIYEGVDYTLAPITIIDENSTPGTVLQTDSLEQEAEPIPFANDQIEGTITPTVHINLESIHSELHDSIELNGSSMYEDVYKTTVLMDLRIDLTANGTFNGFPVEFTHTLVPDQPYAELNVWFANNIGMVRSQYDYSVSEIETTVFIPGFGEIDLEDSPDFDVEELLGEFEINGVAELSTYEVNE